MYTLSVLALGLVVGFIAGKLGAIRRFDRWLKRLPVSDQDHVRSLMRTEVTPGN